MPGFPPLNRWAIGDLSLPGRKNLPLKGEVVEVTGFVETKNSDLEVTVTIT